MSKENSCDCQYKVKCHNLRQELQIEMRQELNLKIEESCPFYKEFIKM